MIERKKVIKGLTVCTKPGTRGCFYDIKECPYDNNGCRMALMRDALSLLKEQEAEIERLKRPDCEHANHDGAGCLGYCGCEQDDEPIEACKRCEKYTGNICEEY